MAATSHAGYCAETFVDTRVPWRTTRVVKRAFLIALLGLAAACPPLAGQVTGKPPGWQTPKPVLDGTATLVGHYNPAQMLRLVIGLHPPNMAEEEQFLQELHTKSSPQFHKFLTGAEWNARFAPSELDEQAVVDWAIAQGLTVTHCYPNRLLVDTEGPVATIEKALNITINSYQLGAKTFFANDRDPAIPSNLAAVVESVGGLNTLQVLRPANKNAVEPAFPDYAPGPVVSQGLSGGKDADRSKLRKALKSFRKGSMSPGSTNGAYDPTDLFSSEAYDTNALYNQGHCCNPLGNPGVTPPETSIAIATAGTQNGSDFTGFHNQYPYLADHWQQFYIDGTPSCCDLEGTMDMEWSTAMSNSFGSYVDTAMVYLYDGINSNFSTFNDIYNQMLTDGHARVMSVSWGCAEVDCFDTADMNTTHAIFNNMVGQGWTLVSISHDGGATTSCVNHDAVNYPGSDPNVVASGGTTLSLFSGHVYNSEVGWTGGPAGCGSNDGGSGGGFSVQWPTPSYQSSLGVGSRALPDVALNADWYYTPQNIFFNGSLSGNGGTSIVAPEMAGFFANENAYLLYLSTVTGGLCNGHVCAPIGNANWYLYYFGENPSYAPHYPFYDITSGCNNNDITALYGLGYYCAGSGYDEVTGWGSVNMFQLAWAINTYQAGDFGAPVVTLSGPTTNHWYNTDQVVSWTVADTSSDGLPPTGVAGFSQAWDSDPGDVFSEPTPGAGNSFYSGPQYPNATSGCLDLTGASCAGSVGQGWHTANVRAWDNTGFTANYTYGPVGYDTIPPQTTASLSGTLTPVTVTLTATDPGAPTTGSGVASTVYQVDGGPVLNYAGPFKVSTLGSHTVTFHSTDVAGNVEGTKTTIFSVMATTSTSVASSLNPVTFGTAVTFTATVSSTGGNPNGSVTFKDGGSTLGTGTLSGGKATLNTSALVGGSNSITAVYGGSAKFVGSTSPVLTETVNKATSATAVASSLNPSTFGTAVTFTATVSSTGGTPTGSVTFKDGSSTLGTGALSGGKATFKTSALAVGSHSITAVYGGSVDFNGSTSSILTQKVNKASSSTTVVSSLNPSTFGTAVTFTATVSSTGGTPTGSVTFKDGSSTLGTGALSGGKATFKTSALAKGTHSITAVYGGSVDFNGSTSAVLSQVVK